MRWIRTQRTTLARSGLTGRNHAFGSAIRVGIAWVLDLKDFRVNGELVDLRPVSEQYAAELQDIVRKHFEETGSEVAEALRADWEAALPRFTEVMPRDSATVLAVQAEAEAEGLDADAAANRVMEVLYG